MNPSSSGIWDNPPPPGTETYEEVFGSSKKVDSQSSRAIDRIDPYLKNPVYIDYEKKSSSRYRSRSRSHDRHRRRRSHSRSKDHHRRSRSRSHRRRRHYSSSRSRSRSRSYSRGRRRHGSKERRHRRSSSRHSRSGSHSHRSHKSKPERSKRSRSKRRSRSHEKPPSDVDITEVDMKIDEDEEEEPVKENAFKNDGSFLEMFKKMQEQQKQQQIKMEEPQSEVKKTVPIFGKRRGGKVLKTGMVQKTKLQNEDDLASGQDAWSVYMKEVRRYKEACCDDDSKTRPLVK